MKTLNKYLNESLLDDEEELVNNDNIAIHQFLKDNYKIIGSYSIKNNIVDVKGDISLTNIKMEYLTNDLFSFGTVTGHFSAGYPHDINIKSLKGAPTIADAFSVMRSKITSLEGGPVEVKYYNVFYNDDLLTLEGSPKTVKSSFACYGCEKLKSLKGAPKEIGNDFDCSGCNSLTSLIGGPEIVKGDYTCDGCINLKNIKGVAKKIGGIFDCDDCPKLSIDEVKKEISNIKCKDVFISK